MLCLILLIAAFAIGKYLHQRYELRQADLNNGDIIVLTDQYNQGTQDADENQTIYLTEEQIHTGDLILVNSDYPYQFEANEDTIDLVKLKKVQKYPYPLDKEDFSLSKKVTGPLEQMIRDCDQALGTNVTGIQSAYRTKEYQQNVWDEMASLYGEDYANKYVAIPGYSEHHTGLAFDLGIIYDDGSCGSFSESQNAVWMAEHASEYGFIRRYAEDKVSITKISNEAWHFRYVGFPHSVYMKQHNLCLEEYLEYLRQNTSPTSQLETEANGQRYRIFYTNEPVVDIPRGEYEISGDNKKGWIITEKIAF